jgi:hypothetical protein
VTQDATKDPRGHHATLDVSHSKIPKQGCPPIHRPVTLGCAVITREGTHR